MKSQILDKIRRLNWVLSETTTGNLSYEELSKILCELIVANIYICDAHGEVLGAAYINIEDKTTVDASDNREMISEEHNRGFLSVQESTANLFGELVTAVLGEHYAMAGKYHTFVPIICGGSRLGTLLLTRYEDKFDDEDMVLSEFCATVVGLEIQRQLAIEEEKENRRKMTVKIALDTLSYSEKDAIAKILEGLEGGEGLIVASKIAAKYGLTNSVIVNALRKLESASLLEAKSLGMKGTRIKILNPYLKDAIADMI